MVWIAFRDSLLVLAVVPLVYYLFTIFVARRFFTGSAAPAPSPQYSPPLSILRPIHGLDRDAYENYASFCRQDYPEFEMLFCVSDENDQAVPVINKLIADFPQRSIRLLVGSDLLGVSDKVNKLCRMAGEARYGLLMVCDSDVRVEPGFLRAIVTPFQNPAIGGVTCLYRGLTDGSLAADLEALGNSTDFAPSVLAARALGGIDFMLGAVMATTKQQLAQIGGFEAMVNHFADDYELGNRIASARRRVELSRFPVSVVYPRETLTDAFRHQTRQNASIKHSRPGGHFGLVFTQGLPWVILAAVLAPFAWLAIAYVAAYLLLRGVTAWVIAVDGLRDDLVRRKLWLLPLRDAFSFVTWLASFFPLRIHWRGQQFYVRDRMLVPISPRHL